MKRPLLVMLIAAIAMISSVTAFAGDHPVYLHALADLRGARWLINQHAAKDAKQSDDEAAVIRAIDAAINEIKRAGLDDHKDITDHTGMDQKGDRASRLRTATSLLKQIRVDVSEKEGSGFGQGLQHKVLVQLNEAIGLLERIAMTK